MAHTTTQPGLQAHSWDPKTDLLKRWVIYKRTPSMIGRLAIASFDHFDEAWNALPTDTTPQFIDGFYRLVSGEDIYTVEAQF